MKLFQDGGLEQDGGTVDPVSGNEVPIGSAKEEVRDDISAKLSEGEFVFPADVVRYYGLESLMKMRQEAKAGLKRMEDMGQMGNSDEATLPDDIPFTPDDVTVEDDAGNEGDLEMQTGGIVPTPYGTQPHQGPGVYSQPSQMGSQFNINPNYQFQPAVAYPMVMPQPQPQTGYGPSFVGQQPVQQPQPHTGFDKLIPMPTQQYNNIRFVNAAGEVMIIPHVDGKPVFPIPEGYSREDGKGDAPKEDAKVDETVDTSVPTATVTDTYEKERDATSPENMRKAEEDRTRSYSNMVESAIKQSGISNPSFEEVKNFIKDGNVKANLFGVEFSVPGLTFNEEDLKKAYDNKVEMAKDTATGKFSGSDHIDKVGPNLGTMFSSAFKKKEEEDKDKTSDLDLEALSKLEEGYKTQKEIDAKEAEKNRKALLAAQMKKEMEQRQAQEQNAKEAEANRAKAREQEEKDAAEATRARTKVSRIFEKQGGPSAKELQKGTKRRFKEGGIASKPKKKAMKRGGLASKK